MFGIAKFFKKRRVEKELKKRFRSTVTSEDEYLLPHQLNDLPQLIKKCEEQGAEVTCVSEAGDEMLPEDQYLIPHLLAEFRDNHKLAMLHCNGFKHAWISIPHLKKVVNECPCCLDSYRSLFDSFQECGYEILKVNYVSFRSAYQGI